MLNIFHDFYSYRWRYYLHKPWRLITEAFYNFRNAWQRIIKGYSFCDVMDMDEYLLHLIPTMLRELVNNNIKACPGNEEFPNFETWETWVNSLADVFESVQQENWEQGRNEFEEEFHTLAHFHNDKHPNLTTTCEYDTSKEHYQEIAHLYFEREKELWDEREKIILDAFHQLATHHIHLWI